MCGIFAYVTYVPRTRREILDALLNGLRRLEYRGYDSAGVSVSSDEVLDDPPPGKRPKVSPSGSGRGPLRRTRPVVFKEQGKIAALQKLVDAECASTAGSPEAVLEAHVGIAHTRWATHGPPARHNSHPHTSDASNDFVVVHNGVITNYKALKEWLCSKGCTFYSDTDTEVVPKLAKYIYDQALEHGAPLSFRKLVTEVVRRLDGAYALLFKSAHFPGELVAAKRGSPLILAVKSQGGSASDGEVHAGEFFLASDASAVIEHTKRVLAIEDDEIVHVRRGGYSIYHVQHEHSPEHPAGSAASVPLPVKVQRSLHELEMEVEQIMKGSYDHFMQKEIHEQPESLTETMRGRVMGTSLLPSPPKAMSGSSNAAAPHINLGGLKEHLGTIRRSRRLIFVACGTSFHACLAARPTMEELTGIPVALELASDLTDRQCPIMRDDTAIFVSQSGETADTLNALEYAKTQGALCVGITNTVGSALSMRTHCGVHVNAGAEIGVASTKAYTSQVVVVVMMALALCEDSMSKRNRSLEIIAGLVSLPEVVRTAVDLDAKMREVAKELVDHQSLLCLGRGFQYATALEAALKIKEVSLCHSEGVLGGEIKHGPLALVDENLPVIVFATKDHNYTKNASVIQQLKARKGRLLIVCSEGDEDLEKMESPTTHILKVPQTVDCLQGVVNVVPMQLLAYHLTCLKGFNVDQPRNLAKSVTVL